MKRLAIIHGVRSPSETLVPCDRSSRRFEPVVVALLVGHAVHKNRGEIAQPQSACVLWIGLG